ncbi:MAG TPA: hypothetical protein VF488_04410 [Gemmatimonadaceae bacterium]
MKRVIFFPYDRGQGEKQTVRDAPRFCCFPGQERTHDLDAGHSARALMQWRERATAKKEEAIELNVFYKNDPRWAGSLLNWADGQIYIVGHCAAGGSTLCSHPSPGDDGAITVEMDSMLHRLGIFHRGRSLGGGHRREIPQEEVSVGCRGDLVS